MKDFGDLTYLKGQINLVPEPMAAMLFMVGAGMMGIAAKKRRRG